MMATKNHSKLQNNVRISLLPVLHAKNGAFGLPKLKLTAACAHAEMERDRDRERERERKGKAEIKI